MVSRTFFYWISFDTFRKFKTSDVDQSRFFSLSSITFSSEFSRVRLKIFEVKMTDSVNFFLFSLINLMTHVSLCLSFEAPQWLIWVIKWLKRFKLLGKCSKTKNQIVVLTRKLHNWRQFYQKTFCPEFYFKQLMHKAYSNYLLAAFQRLHQCASRNAFV